MSPDQRAADLRLDPLYVRRRLKEAGLRARHNLSQNFLADVDVLEGILREADPVPGRAVLEIGPGLGFLTGASSPRAPPSRRWSSTAGSWPSCARRSPTSSRTAGSASSRTTPSTRTSCDLCPPPYDVVANLPYHITSPILHRLLGREPRARHLVLMVQREVAERIAAAPGDLSYLSVFVQYHAKARVAFRVGRDSFEPAPKVESAVLVLEPYPPDDRLDAAAEDNLWRLVQAGFRERRKMLHNVLTRQLPIDGARVDAALEACGIDRNRRPQTVAVGEWLALAEALGPIPDGHDA